MNVSSSRKDPPARKRMPAKKATPAQKAPPARNLVPTKSIPVKKAPASTRPAPTRKAPPARKTPAEQGVSLTAKSLTAFDQWSIPATIEVNNFSFKSLSNWSYNISMGCIHGCPFCYVPGKVMDRLEKTMEKHLGDTIPSQWVDEREAGGHWADTNWGKYSFIRAWDEKAFQSSLKTAISLAAENDNNPNLPSEKRLPKDGNRAIILCSTTDPYQTLSIPGNIEKQKLLNTLRENVVRNALEIILKDSELNVRILTRSPLAIKDFDLYKKFGNRLVFGMSFPTTNEALSRIYEPSAPGPTAKMKTLIEAKKQGLHVYVALAPTMPEQTESDLRHTMQEIAKLEPLTVFHEPINIRAGNIERIKAHAKLLAERENSQNSKQVLEILKSMRSEVFATKETWREYAYEQLSMVERIARELKFPEGVLHLWPDKELGNREGFMDMKLMQAARDSHVVRLSQKQHEEAEAEWQNVSAWINYWHNEDERISSWPGIRMPKWD